MRIINRRLWIVAIVAMFLVGSTSVVDAKTKKGKTKTTTTKTGKTGKKTQSSNSNNIFFTVNGGSCSTFSCSLRWEYSQRPRRM